MKDLVNQVKEFTFCPMGNGKPSEGVLVPKVTMINHRQLDGLKQHKFSLSEF